MPAPHIGGQQMEIMMARHVARMMDGDRFSAAVIKADIVLATGVLMVAAAAYLV